MNSALWVENLIYATNSFKEIIPTIKTIFYITVHYLHWIHSNHYRYIIHLVYMFLSCELLCSNNLLIAIKILRKYCFINIDDVYLPLEEWFDDICIGSSKFDVFWPIILVGKLLFIVYWVSHWSEMPSDDRTRIRDSINPINMLCQCLWCIKWSLF